MIRNGVALLLCAINFATFNADSDFVDSQSNLPVCSSDNDQNAAACYRIDLSTPDSLCIMRDPDSQQCLKSQTVKHSESGLSCLGNPLSTECLQSQGLSFTEPVISDVCDGRDPLCILKSNLEAPIDWSQVDGAEFLMKPAIDTADYIYLDSIAGNDQKGLGTIRRPFRSFRAALSKWLRPGKCWPFCSSISPEESATIVVRPGDYRGDWNQNIDILLFAGCNLTITSDGTQGIIGPYVRDSGVDIHIDGIGSHFIRVDGSGRLALLGLNLINSSSEALFIQPEIQLTTDLFFPHGRYGTWMQTVDANGAVTRSPTWDVEADERVRNKVISCDGAAGCRPVGPRPGFDPLFYGPTPESRAPCDSCFRIPTQPGEAGGLAVAVKDVGTGCITGGTLVAVGKGPGAGFSATFTVASGAVTSVHVVDYGSGYVDAATWQIVVNDGGLGCKGVVFVPYVVTDSAYDFLFTPASQPA